MLRISLRPEPRDPHRRPTDMSTRQRRRVAIATVVMLLLTAGLIALSLSAVTPASDRLLSTVAQHHAAVPIPVRSLSGQSGHDAPDQAVLGSAILLGLGLVLWLRRRSTPVALAARERTAQVARGPPYRR